MRSHLTLQILTELVTQLHYTKFQHFRAFPARLVMASLCNLAEGRMLIHTLSNYLFSLDLFEANLIQDTQLKALIDKSSFFMFAVMQGTSVFRDEQDNPISETTGNSCTLTYLSTGSYKWHLNAGQHQILLITFKEDYLIRKCTPRPLLKPLADAYQQGNLAHLALPHCPIARGMFKLLKKRLGENIDLSKIDLITHATIDAFLDNYEKSLSAGHYDTNTVHKLKTVELIDFIHQHYAEKDVSDLRMLANRFNLSERSLLRLIKKAFHMPLYQYLIKYRMNIAMIKLSTSKRPVKEIAAEVGYTDPLYFSKVFKKHYNIAPSDVVPIINNIPDKNMENSCI